MCYLNLPRKNEGTLVSNLVDILLTKMITLNSDLMDYTPKSPKLTALKIVYLLLIVILITGLSVELFFVVERNLSVRRVENYKAGLENIYSARFATEAYSETLWKVEFEKYKPNAVLDKTVGNERYVVKINSHGFRTKEFRKEKPENVYRIVAIGGSTTVQGRTNDSTYPAILERKLKEKFPNLNIEVLNFGISGTKSDYWLDRLDELFEFKPDLIIQYNAVNDLSWEHMYGRKKCTNLIKYLWRKVINLSFILQKSFPTDTSLLDNCLMWTLNNFKEISSEAKARGIEYIVGSFASPDYNMASNIFRQYLDSYVQSSWGRGLKLKYYSSYHEFIVRYNKFFQSYVEQNNLTSVFVDKAISDPNLFIDVCHMTPDGIEKLADSFFDGVIKIMDKELSSGKHNSPPFRN